MATCKYGDPTCPCQDGDACHYEGENPWSVPPKYTLNARAEGYAAGYEKGQREMRERAAQVINRSQDAGGSRYIYALPIIEEPKEKVHHSPGGRNITSSDYPG